MSEAGAVVVVGFGPSSGAVGLESGIAGSTYWYDQGSMVGVEEYSRSLLKLI